RAFFVGASDRVAPIGMLPGKAVAGICAFLLAHILIGEPVTHFAGICAHVQDEETALSAVPATRLSLWIRSISLLLTMRPRIRFFVWPLTFEPRLGLQWRPSCAASWSTSSFETLGLRPSSSG